MKKPWSIVTLAAMVVLLMMLVMPSGAMAASITGGISFSGGVSCGSGCTDFTTGTQLTFNTNIVTATAGSYSVVPINTTVTINPVNYNLIGGGSVPGGIARVFTSGGITYELNNATITSSSVAANNITIADPGRL